MKDNNNNIMPFSLVHFYVNADIQKTDICKDNNNKTGIYKWTHITSGKSYIGSAVYLSNRLRNYYNVAYLERETTKNNSMIYKALLKYGYSSFKLDILEYCNRSYRKRTTLFWSIKARI
jgi:group I intron endonuclease